MTIDHIALAAAEVEANPGVRETGGRALIVDLNNFARYPTMAIGYLAASLALWWLRRRGHDTAVVRRARDERERPERLREHVERRVYMSTDPVASSGTTRFGPLAAAGSGGRTRGCSASSSARCSERPADALLLSADPVTTQGGGVGRDRRPPRRAGAARRAGDRPSRRRREARQHRVDLELLSPARSTCPCRRSSTHFSPATTCPPGRACSCRTAGRAGRGAVA